MERLSPFANRRRQGCSRPSGTFLVVPLFPALKRWATGNRSSGAVNAGVPLGSRPFQTRRHCCLQATIAIAVILVSFVACAPSHHDRIVIGSKNFTEQLILGEILAQHIESKTHIPVDRRFYLAGTFICQQGILSGRIDIYPEYTGTALTAILKQKPGGDRRQVYESVKSQYATGFHLEVGPPLGFDDTFAIEIRGADARRLHLQTISQAAPYTPKWRAGFGYEFMERPDGYKGLVATYNLHFAEPPRIMDLGLLTRALNDKQVDLIAGNTTDGLIPAFDLFVLQDDRHYFPPYEAVPVVREEALRLHPEVRAALDDLAGKISDADMRALNYAVDGQHRDAKKVVSDFLRKKGL
jgi:glycine betaine/choline ABC-type transport system substrate-binding protein